MPRTKKAQPRTNGANLGFEEKLWQAADKLSSVLPSKRAAQINVEIMRTFVRLRRILNEHKDLAQRLGALEKKYDSQFKAVFDAIRQLMAPPEPSKRRIGFRQGNDEAGRRTI